jgi:hypothetical protein
MPAFSTLQLTNLLQTTFLFGLNFSLSYISIPATLLSSPTIAVQQWNSQFNKGLVTAMPLTVSSLLLSGLLASRSDEDVRVLYGISSGLGFLVFPFTVWFMEPINKVLIKQEKGLGKKGVRAGDEEEEKDAGMLNAKVSSRVGGNEDG